VEQTNGPVVGRSFGSAFPGSLGWEPKARQGRLIVLTVALLLLALGGVGATPAYSALSFPDGAWGARWLDGVSSRPLDGTTANVTVTRAAATPNCVLFTSGVAAGSVDRQLQIGFLQCQAGSQGLDPQGCGKSGNIVGFAEKYHAGVYECILHGNLTLNSANSFGVRRDAAGSTTWSTYLNGPVALDHHGPYPASGATSDTSIFEWAEIAAPPSGLTSCSLAGGAAAFRNWQRWLWSSGAWFTPTSSNVFQGCWSVGTMTSGGWDVSKS
jgi:hypothetical protein